MNLNFRRTGKGLMVLSFYFGKGDFASLQQDALVLEHVAHGRREAVLLAVCDGIGGLSEGEYASSYVTMRIRDWFYGDCLKHLKRRHDGGRIKRDCLGMLYDCNRYLQRYGKERGIRLGTTMTMAVLYSRQLFGFRIFSHAMRYMLFHAGDSKAYVVGKTCRRLTEDDSYGDRTLHKCIGSFPWQDVQKKQGCLRRGEKLLLCSDGFWRELEEKEIAESFRWKKGWGRRRKLTEAQAEKRLRKLGQTGRTRGEKDNQAAVCCIFD